jgi:hypothetical protein
VVGPTPDPTKGILEVRIREFAQVLVDGKEAGNTLMLKARPLVLTPGPHEIELRNSECDPLKETVNLTAGATTKFVRHLPNCRTFVTIVPAAWYRAHPEARVYIDDQERGIVAAGTALETRSGLRQIRITLPDFAPYVAEVDVGTHPQDNPQRVNIGALEPVSVPSPGPLP